MSNSRRSYTVRSSTIFVAEGDRTEVFRSMEDVPLDTRERLLKSTSGAGAATIFIANKGGRRELARRLKGLPSRIRTRMEPPTEAKAEAVQAASPVTPAPAPAPMETPKFATGFNQFRPAARQILLVAASAGLLVWLLAGLK
ncbi:MAG: hypothetical protein NTV70_13985 [Acidobacteria bacterium]|nr:hypothetical protein [Acidobacteriota bacterium]